MAAFRLRPLMLIVAISALLTVSMQGCGRPALESSTFSLSISLSNVQLASGESSALTITVKTTAPLDAPVVLTLRSPDDTALPDGLSASFDPASLLPTVSQSATSKLKLVTQPQLSDDTYPLVVYARSQGQETSLPLKLIVDSSGSTWRRPIGTAKTDQILAIGADHSGGVYLAANTSGAFGNNQNLGGFDGYLLHYRANGAVSFVTPFATAGSDVVTALAVDSDDSVYLTGYTYGTFNGQLTAGKADAFLAKLDSSGLLIWLRQFGTAEFDQLLSVTIGADGAVYTGGLTEGSFPGQMNAGLSDVFVAKWSPTGQQLWLTEFGTAAAEQSVNVAQTAGVGITVDAQGAVYVCGSTNGAFPGFTNAGNGDAFVTRLESTGKQGWLQQLGSYADDALLSIAAHSNGQVYAVGYSRGPLAGQVQLGGQDGILLAYKSDGSRSLTRQLGTSYTDVINAITVVSDQLLLIGTTRGAFPGQTQNGGQDVFYARISPDGPTQWLRQTGTGQSDNGTAISAAQGNLYIAGITFGDFANPSTVLTESDGFLSQILLP